MRVGPFTRLCCRILVIFVNRYGIFWSVTELYFKSPINIHGKLDAPSLIKYKVTPGGVM